MFLLSTVLRLKKILKIFLIRFTTLSKNYKLKLIICISTNRPYDLLGVYRLMKTTATHS